MLTRMTQFQRGAVPKLMKEAEVDDIPPTGEQVELDVRARNVASGMASLDEFRLPEILKQRARVMQTIPLFLKGALCGWPLKKHNVRRTTMTR